MVVSGLWATTVELGLATREHVRLLAAALRPPLSTMHVPDGPIASPAMEIARLQTSIPVQLTNGI
jgi:hypothetical protein